MLALREIKGKRPLLWHLCHLRASTGILNAMIISHFFLFFILRGWFFEKNRGTIRGIFGCSMVALFWEEAKYVVPGKVDDVQARGVSLRGIAGGGSFGGSWEYDSPHGCGQ